MVPVITYMLAIMGPKYGISPEMYYSGWASQRIYAKNTVPIGGV